MAYIKKKSERKFKITVCNGYKVNGQKRMKAQTITVPSSVPKRGIQQYVMAEAERIEKKFKYGVEESDQTHFEQYAENWLKRQEPFFKATTYAGYKRNLDIVYPLIGGIPLAKLLPMTLEEMCEELRKRPGRGGKCIKETTVQKYLETVSSVLEDAKKNDIIPFNPAHRVRKKHIEKEVQHIPQKYEMSKLMWAIQNEPILYRAYYTLAITTGLRRGELCALQWRDITGACELTVRRSRSCASGEIVESDTKSHRERIVTIPLGIWELLMALRQQQVLYSGVPDRKQPIFTDPDGHVPHPDTFTRHLRKLYKQCGLSEPFFKATTYAGYKRNLDIVYPLIGGIPLAKLLPMTLEEMCEELRKRPGRGGNCIKETTVEKYLETVSSVLEDAKKNDIIPFNPAHRVRKKHFEKEAQHIPQKYEMGKLMRAIQNEPILYRAYYTLAITTGLRRGELCALQWRDITGACELTVRRSRSCASGQIVESDTKSHRERIVTIPLGIWELLMALRQQQVLHSGVPDREQPIFTDPDGHVPHPDSFTRHLRKLYKKCGLSEDYHLHTLRHFYATYLLQEGTSKQVAASLLGHADTAFLERTYCHPQDVAKRQAANLMQDLLNNQNPCYVAFMKNKNRKAKKAG